MKRFKDFNRLYEFEEKQKMPSAEQISFMDDLYQKIKKEIVPIIPTQYKVDYDRNKGAISVHTDNKKDLTIEAKINDDKMVFSASPINQPEFQFNYNFYSANAVSILNIIKGEFEKSETNGIYTGKEETKERYLKSYRDDDDDIDSDESDEEDEAIPNEEIDDIDIPIVKKPKRIKRSIDMRIIKNVLEDAYILDDIDLKSVTIDELLRRMLLESRK